MVFILRSVCVNGFAVGIHSGNHPTALITFAAGAAAVWVLMPAAAPERCASYGFPFQVESVCVFLCAKKNAAQKTCAEKLIPAAGFALKSGAHAHEFAGLFVLMSRVCVCIRNGNVKYPPRECAVKDVCKCLPSAGMFRTKHTATRHYLFRLFTTCAFAHRLKSGMNKRLFREKHTRQFIRQSSLPALSQFIRMRSTPKPRPIMYAFSVIAISSRAMFVGYVITKLSTSYLRIYLPTTNAE